MRPTLIAALLAGAGLSIASVASASDAKTSKTQCEGGVVNVSSAGDGAKDNMIIVMSPEGERKIKTNAKSFKIVIEKDGEPRIVELTPGEGLGKGFVFKGDDGEIFEFKGKPHGAFEFKSAPQGGIAFLRGEGEAPKVHAFAFRADEDAPTARTFVFKGDSVVSECDCACCKQGANEERVIRRGPGADARVLIEKRLNEARKTIRELPLDQEIIVELRQGLADARKAMEDVDFDSEFDFEFDPDMMRDAQRALKDALKSIEIKIDREEIQETIEKAMKELKSLHFQADGDADDKDEVAARQAPETQQRREQVETERRLVERHRDRAEAHRRDAERHRVEVEHRHRLAERKARENAPEARNQDVDARLKRLEERMERIESLLRKLSPQG